MTHRFFNHQKCTYFPCHQGIKDEEFNCMFCYCPLYVLGNTCGGNYKYVEGIKDCSDCLFPHLKDNYEKIIERYPEIAKIMK